jgi:hypothetical protein
MSQESQGGPPSEEELRARLEEELRKVTVRDVLLQTIVTLVNIGGQRLGLGGPTDPAEAEAEGRDLEQVRMAIEAVRALLPLLETSEEGAEQVRPIRDALAQLQLVYAREVSSGDAGKGPAGGEGTAPPSRPQKPPQPRGEAERGGDRGGLWVPPGTKT